MTAVPSASRAIADRAAFFAGSIRRWLAFTAIT
jgi:hypothetical protein